jgi:diguanylate cyclase (GGDEF)-like protein
MTPDSLADSPDPAGPRRLGSLRLRITVAVPLLTALIVGLFEWSLGGVDWKHEGLPRLAWLVLLLSAAQLLLVELLMLRPLQRLAVACEAMASAPVTVPVTAQARMPVFTSELDRIGEAMRRARGSLWQQGQEVHELRRDLAQQRQLLQQAHTALEANQRELASLARVDALTGIANQRAFDEALRREFKRAQRLRGLLAVAVLDLDQFKQFNQTHGAAAGDEALKQVAGLLNERFKRDTDLVARLGGEEFVALLPGFGLAEAQGVLETLREEVRALRLPDGRGDLTVSIGLAAASPAHPYLSAQALLQAADEALYIAKHAGRDRLSLAA